jgi:hypothetical protein
MEADTQIFSIAPAPRAVRGYTSSLDVSELFLLSFNGNSVVLRSHQAHLPTLSINHVSDVAAARFSHDGRMVASIDVKGTLIIS